MRIYFEANALLLIRYFHYWGDPETLNNDNLNVLNPAVIIEIAEIFRLNKAYHWEVKEYNSVD